MKRLYPIALALGLITALPASLLAQTPAAGNNTPAPAASPAPAPAASPAPAATPAPAASPSAAATPADKSEQNTASKKKSRRTSRRQEIQHAIDSGTVPSRYRKYVPKEYQQDIPFERR